jgi:hypothetical protein
LGRILIKEAVDYKYINNHLGGFKDKLTMGFQNAGVYKALKRHAIAAGQILDANNKYERAKKTGINSTGYFRAQADREFAASGGSVNDDKRSTTTADLDRCNCCWTVHEGYFRASAVTENC